MSIAALSVFGVPFLPAEPTSAVDARIRQFFAGSKELYDRRYQCFACVFYKDSYILRARNLDTTPAGLSSMWICNGQDLSPYTLQTQDLAAYNRRFSLWVDETTVRSYAAFVAHTLKVEGMQLYKPTMGQVRGAGLLERDILSVSPDPNGWSAEALYVDGEDRRFTRVSYHIRRDGHVPQGQVSVKKSEHSAKTPSFIR